MIAPIVRFSLFAGLLLGVACGGGSEQQAASETRESDSSPASDAPRPAPGTITVSGVVFEDADRDGAVDEGETRLSGQQVTLMNPPATEDYERATTDADGTFRFDKLGAGEYRLTLRVPDGFQRTTDDSFLIELREGVPPSDVRFGVVKQ